MDIDGSLTPDRHRIFPMNRTKPVESRAKKRPPAAALAALAAAVTILAAALADVRDGERAGAAAAPAEHPGSSNPPGIMTSNSAAGGSGTEPSSFLSLSYTRDYEPGALDSDGRYMGGTGCMYLVPHQGRLWAGIGYWNDVPGTDPTPGPQILVKESSGGPWRVDFAFGADYVRVDALMSVTFTSDRHGTALDPPVTRLVAGCSDNASPYRATVWTRDPASPPGQGVWTPADLPGITGTQATYVRHFFAAVDPVTGVHNLFAGVTHRKSELRRGAWDAVGGTIVWDEVSELVGPPRILSSATPNGRLYVTVGSDGIPDNNYGGLFRRVDGLAPRWECVYEWPNIGRPDLGTNLRGLTAVPRPEGGADEVLIGTIENLQTFVRIDPAAGHAASVELDAKAFFLGVWGDGADFYYAAYNDTLWADDPSSGERVLLIGTWAKHPNPYGTPERNNAWMLIRHLDGRYEAAWVMDPAHPSPPTPGLMGIRTIAPSPFPSERGRVWYFGGCDAGASQPMWHNSAWIYRGEAVAEIASTLTPGYNLIALPLTPQAPLTAEGLAQQINAQGGTCTSVIAYDSATGAFVTHPAGTAVSNFDVVTGRGYFVRCTAASTWRILGFRFNALSGDVPLTTGYTLVSLPVEPSAPRAYTAEAAAIEINAQGGGATQIIRYDETRGQFVTHPVGTAVENFSLELGRGYFVRCTNSSRWTITGRFPIDDIAVGDGAISYVDPEFISQYSRMVFQEGGTRDVYVSRIDPLTGTLVSADGKDLRVDTQIATLGATGQTFNGPEWGLDSAGPAIFYEKTGANGLVQVWRAEGVLTGPVQIQQLTASSPTGSTSKLVRQDATRPSTAFAFKLASSATAPGPVHWADESDPTTTFLVPGFISSSYQVAWLPGTEDLVYVRFSSQTTVDLARFNGATRTSTFLTFSEPGLKKNPVAFLAPELGGELVIGCVIDGTALALFRQNGTQWIRWTALTPPEDAARPFLYSPEIFQVAGVTYFAVLMKDVDDPEAGNDGAIWLMSVGADPARHLYRRLDDGAVTGLALKRFEPEPFIGTEEVFVFYNVLSGDISRLRRARTGVLLNP
jgi:hypothetical protein